MSDHPVQIQPSEIKVGDKILIKRIEKNPGEEHEVAITITIQGVVDVVFNANGSSFDRVKLLGSQSCYFLSNSGGVNETVYLLHRPPTRRAISGEDLKDWKKVPIGTRIELVEMSQGKKFCGNIVIRVEDSATDSPWRVVLSGIGTVYLTEIKPDTLFVVE